MSRHVWTELGEGDSIGVARVGGRLVVSVSLGGRTERDELPIAEVKHSPHDAVVFGIRTIMQRFTSQGKGKA